MVFILNKWQVLFVKWATTLFTFSWFWWEHIHTFNFLLTSFHRRLNSILLTIFSYLFVQAILNEFRSVWSPTLFALFAHLILVWIWAWYSCSHLLLGWRLITELTYGCSIIADLCSKTFVCHYGSVDWVCSDVWIIWTLDHGLHGLALFWFVTLFGVVRTWFECAFGKFSFLSSHTFNSHFSVCLNDVVQSIVFKNSVKHVYAVLCAGNIWVLESYYWRVIQWVRFFWCFCFLLEWCSSDPFKCVAPS